VDEDFLGKLPQNNPVTFQKLSLDSLGKFMLASFHDELGKGIDNSNRYR
jgi:hypothetical protein